MQALAGSPELMPFFSYLAGRMDFKDSPHHARLVSQVFTPHAVEAMRPHIQRLVDHCLARVQGQGHMDGIRDLAFPLPGMVIGELLALPAADRNQLKALADTFVGFFKSVPSDTSREDYQRSFQAAQALGSYFQQILAQPVNTRRAS
jgi:cytochrome P450